jgi:8-oxo-dGTP pyrophosphatase MutT (NUDIX family)
VDEKVDDRIRRILGSREVRPLSDTGRRVAAVLMPLFVRDGELHVLLTKRSNDVEHHKGQISFPGGVRDAHDADLLATALRETWEEIGVPPEEVRVLGRLDDHATLTDFRITPFVGMIPWPFAFRVSGVEIERLIEVPLAAFLDNPTFTVHFAGLTDRRYVVYSYEVRGDIIWGATARILTQFLHLVHGFEAPHVEEPEE